MVDPAAVPVLLLRPNPMRRHPDDVPPGADELTLEDEIELEGGFEVTDPQEYVEPIVDLPDEIFIDLLEE